MKPLISILLLSETEIKVSALSVAIQARLKKEFSDFDVTEASKIESAGRTASYEAEIKKEKEAFDVVLAADGRVLKKSKIDERKEKKD